MKSELFDLLTYKHSCCEEPSWSIYLNIDLHLDLVKIESQKESASKAKTPKLLLSVADAMKLVLNDEIDQSDFESDSDMMASQGKDG